MCYTKSIKNKLFRKDELIDAFDLPEHWLMMQMNNYIIGANYNIYKHKHRIYRFYKIKI